MKDLLGEGGFGKVFMAKNRLNKEKVAIKLIDRNKMSKLIFYFKIDQIQNKKSFKLINIYYN